LKIQWVIKGILGIMLIICGISDIKSRKISLSIVIFSFISMVIFISFNKEVSYISGLGGVLVGVFLLILSRITKGEIGIGDGLIFCVTGLGLGMWDNLCLLVYSLFFASIFAGVVLVTKWMDKKQVIPFVPFVLAGYLGILLV
jgi:leader peptidase (prepilin peptidase) / N-methyltransferase